MKSSLIQRNADLVSDVLTGLYESQKEVKEGYKYWKARVDANPFDSEAVEALGKHRGALPKFHKKIRALEELQRALKLEAKDAARIDAWMREDDAFWLQQAEIAKGSGFVTYDYDELAKMFGDE